MVPPGELTSYCPGAEEPLNLRDDLLNRSLLDKERFRDFMSNWVERAIQAAQNGQPFDALICLWIVFNAWLGEVVVDRDYNEIDWYLVQAAGRDRNLSNRFVEMLQNNAELRGEASEFQSLWPVFKVRTLLDHGIRPWCDKDQGEDRHEYRVKCFSYKLKRRDYAPPCFCDHQKGPGECGKLSPLRVPLDWAHTLSAIYKVRCNLFHGGKGFRNSGDLRFSELAFSLLWKLWAEGESFWERRTIDAGISSENAEILL